MDAIDFLRKEYNVPKDKLLVDVIGKQIPLDRVFRHMEKYKNTISIKEAIAIDNDR